MDKTQFNNDIKVLNSYISALEDAYKNSKNDIESQTCILKMLIPMMTVIKKQNDFIISLLENKE